MNTLFGNINNIQQHIIGRTWRTVRTTRSHTGPKHCMSDMRARQDGNRSIEVHAHGIDLCQLMLLVTNCVAAAAPESWLHFPHSTLKVQYFFCASCRRQLNLIAGTEMSTGFRARTHTQLGFWDNLLARCRPGWGICPLMRSLACQLQAPP